jgi:WD40 repeat protein
MVRIWSAVSGVELRCLEGQDSGSCGVAFSADGSTLAACGIDNDVRLWDLPAILPAKPDR